jgi:serine/threonine protein kinase HipA of HipAB toxin-antitoxin module
MLDVLRELGRDPQDIGRTLFERIVFNIAIGNNDDHARNHAALWDERSLELTPAFDLTPRSALPTPRRRPWRSVTAGAGQAVPRSA